jgi:putative ABC transport system permease protein
MTNGVSVPSWSGVAASLLLVAVVAAVAYRQRLRLARELVVASIRAGIQLIAAGAVLLLVFEHTGLPGAFGWVTMMVIIAGQVAGRHGAGLPHSRRAATVGIATGTILTLGGLVVLGVISTQSRVVVPDGGMIVSSAMQAAGIALRRLGEDARQARPEIEARLCLGLTAHQAFVPTSGPHCAPRCCRRSTRPRSSG